MYSIHGFNFSSSLEVCDALQSSPNLCHTEEAILDRMIRDGLEIDVVLSKLSRACVAYYLGDDATKDQEDELLGIAWEEWRIYTAKIVIPWPVEKALMFAETEGERRDALEDYEA